MFPNDSLSNSLALSKLSISLARGMVMTTSYSIEEVLCGTIPACHEPNGPAIRSPAEGSAVTQNAQESDSDLACQIATIRVAKSSYKA